MRAFVNTGVCVVKYACGTSTASCFHPCPANPEFYTLILTFVFCYGVPVVTRS